jgi:hypothetical protein
VHIKDGIAASGAFIVAGREIDPHVAAIGQNAAVKAGVKVQPGREKSPFRICPP